jgi:4-hydroxybenzoate polyprenyltransferase
VKTQQISGENYQRQEASIVALRKRGWAASLWVEMRPWQWTKNLFVLAPLFFSQNLLVPLAAGRAFMAFVLFCLISSSVYILNDIRDWKQDRIHPEKCHRPLAAGELSMKVALGAMVALLLCALAGGVMLSTPLALILVGYWLINCLYSVWLKHQVILDVFALSSGFVLRVAGGAMVLQVEISHWLLLCTLFLALFLGFSKRRHELGLLREAAGAHREVLGEYNLHFLDMMIGIVTASTLMSYALYTVSEETVRKFHTRGLLLTLPFALYGLFRYLYLIYHKTQLGDPTQSLLTDRPMMINLGLWVLTVGVFLY